MPSYSVILKAEVAKQKADDCAQLKPHVLPKTVQAAIASLPANVSAMTSDQVALLDWFNDDVAEAANHESYCG